MACGFGRSQALACQDWVGHVLTLFAPRKQDPQAPVTNHAPNGTRQGCHPHPPGLMFGDPHLSAML